MASNTHNTMAGAVAMSSIEPENPRQDMEGSDMSPDDARRFIKDLMTCIRTRCRRLPEEQFEPNGTPTHPAERSKQHYGDETWQLIAGIHAGLIEWDESGRDVQELKDEYDGKFVEGVEIGERLAVYEGRDFTFSEGEDTSEESKFTFTQ